ncbi:hypothetical protein V5N11_036427 [Cardamine amara subsp. amara]|uniref:SWIM-type domain-containing protein n=1 Tax=Cardamine amara subsp. amara TaxID=228776 RepID=A0ABD0ZU21_CARAN
MLLQNSRQIARIYTIAEFEKQYEDFRMRFPKAATYLDTTCEVEKWARCYFPGLKYNIQTSNVVESMNSVFKQARKFALLPMIDTIVAKFAEWFNNHRKESVGGSNAQKLVPFVENVLHDRCEIASKLTVIELNSFQLEYSVIGPDGKTYVVDLRNKSCICRCFDLDKYPCVHAIAAAMKLKQENRTNEVRDLYDLCSKYYLVELWVLAYVNTIYPVPHKTEWTIPSEIEELYALPPKYNKRKGRIQETRKPSVGERRRKHKRQPGSNLEKWFRSESGTPEQSED